MFPSMRSQVVLLIAQFGGGGRPSRAWPDYVLLIVTALAIVANIAFTLMVVRPRYSLRALLFGGHVRFDAIQMRFRAEEECTTIHGG